MKLDTSAKREIERQRQEMRARDVKHEPEIAALETRLASLEMRVTGPPGEAR